MLLGVIIAFISGLTTNPRYCDWLKSPKPGYFVPFAYGNLIKLVLEERKNVFILFTYLPTYL